MLLTLCAEDTADTSKAIAQASYDDTKPWPFELYQAAIINIIFAFETGVSHMFLK